MLYLKYFKQLATRIALLLLVAAIIRVSYYLYNINYFSAPSIYEWTQILWGGLRFDFESLIYINSLFIVLSVLPVPFRNNRIYKSILKVLFIITNIVFIVIEIGDMVYFQYVFRRINGSDLSFLFNSFEVLPGLMIQHIEGIFFFVPAVFILWYIYKKTDYIIEGKRNYFIGILIFLLTLGIAAIGSRGGLQLRPLSPISASGYVTRKELTPLVSNGTIHLLFATEQSYLKKKNYYSKENVSTLFNPVKKAIPENSMNKKNVFIIALESFGKEYVGHFNKSFNKSFTPFLDSLINESFLFENAYACGSRSPNGIAGIGASIPTLMSEPLSFSAYQTNCIDGLGSLLNEVGYTTGFFHGARPTSMNIDRLAKLEGFEHIFTKKEFNDPSKFDGEWGIWDDPFFQFTLENVNKFKQPFLAFLFSMSSHPPYVVEKWFEEKYPGEDKILRSVRYSDYALRHFFEKAKKQAWYDNTIFIISADHIGRAFDKKYTTMNTRYQIPILFYTPDSTFRGKYSGVFMQTDIIPTLLNYLQYPRNYIAFGNNAFDTLAPHYAYTFASGMYQILDDNYILFFDGNKTTGFYNLKKDPLMTNNIFKIKNKNKDKLEAYLKALIQTHNELMIDNKICNYNYNKNK